MKIHRLEDPFASDSAFELAVLAELNSDLEFALGLLTPDERVLIELMHGVCTRYRDQFSIQEAAQYLCVHPMRARIAYETILDRLSRVPCLRGHRVSWTLRDSFLAPRSRSASMFAHAILNNPMHRS